jgi:hypothetical protein
MNNFSLNDSRVPPTETTNSDEIEFYNYFTSILLLCNVISVPLVSVRLRLEIFGLTALGNNSRATGSGASLLSESHDIGKGFCNKFETHNPTKIRDEKY